MKMFRARLAPIIPEEAEGGLEVPVIYFEVVATQGTGLGVGSMALEMLIVDPAASGKPLRYRRKIVAQLRAPAGGWESMREALDQMAEDAASQSPGASS